MTGSHAETLRISSTAVVLPRVNLLPPEIAAGRAFRKVQCALGAGVLATFGIVGVLFLLASSSAKNAGEQVNAATARSSQLTVEAARYAEVSRVYARAAAAQVMLTQAMGEEVRYSQLLNDLSLRVPENVWVKALSFNQLAAGVAPLGSVTPGVGVLSVTGMAFDHDDVAVWLESLAAQKSYSDPDFANSTESLLGTREVVTFSSTANLTTATYSGRYAKPAGS